MRVLHLLGYVPGLISFPLFISSFILLQRIKLYHELIIRITYSLQVRLFEAKGVQIDGWGRDKFMASTMLNDPEFGFQV